MIPTPYRHYLLALLAGCLLPLAFAPFSIAAASLISIAIFCHCLHNKNVSQGFVLGWLYGIGQFAVGVSWVYVSIHQYGNANGLLALLLTGLFIAAMGFYPALFGGCYQLLFKNAKITLQILSCAALWTLFEWLRATLFTGFPWLLLGYTQVQTPLKYLAPLIGVYGLSFVTVLAACLLFWGLKLLNQRKGRGYRYLIILLLVYIVPSSLKTIGWTMPNSGRLQVSIIQGDIPITEKWSNEELGNILEHYRSMTDHNWQSHLIVWPEAAIPLPYQYATDYLQELAMTAQQHHATVVTGIPFIKKGINGPEYFNGIITVGNGSGQYYKHHLVPFGEFLPLEKWLRHLVDLFNIPMSDILPGPLHQPLLIANNVKIAPFICYEIAYSDMLLHDLPQAELIITISDDGWFGKSFASAQHLEIAQMRSLQTGRYQIVANNSGISAIISPKGKILKTVPQFKPEVLTGTYKSMQGTTPWAAMGDSPIIVVLLLLMMIMVTMNVSSFKAAH